jgi:hypothetical protein
MQLQLVALSEQCYGKESQEAGERTKRGIKEKNGKHKHVKNKNIKKKIIEGEVKNDKVRDKREIILTMRLRRREMKDDKEKNLLTYLRR